MSNNPKDADGVTLHEGDRVYGLDHTDFGVEKCYGTLGISDHPATIGRWYVEYDDGESFIVLDFTKLYKA